MKTRLIVILSCILLVFTACTVQQKTLALDSVNVISKLSVLKNQYQTIYTIIIKKDDKVFTAEEKSQLLEIDQNARMIYKKINDIVKFKDFDISPDEARFLYNTAKENYVIAKSIIIKHIDSFSILEVNRLKMFDKQLQELDESITKLLDNPETNDAKEILLTILQVTSISLKIILPLLL